MVMSENGQSNPSGSHSQSRTLSAGGGPQGENSGRGIIQSETIKRLDDIITEYTAQCTPLHGAVQLINAILAENPTLTNEQRAQSSQLYGGRLEQAATARVQAIAWGSRLEPEQDRTVDAAPEDGIREPNPDGATGPTVEASANPNPNYLFTLQSGAGQQNSSLKRIGEEEGTERGEYAWNWDKPGGGAPWKDDDKDLLSTSDKTHLLRNAYAANIKRAVQSLEAQ